MFYQVSDIGPFGCLVYHHLLIATVDIVSVIFSSKINTANVRVHDYCPSIQLIFSAVLGLILKQIQN